MTAKEALKQIANTTISSRIGDWGMESRHVSDILSIKEPLQIVEQAIERAKKVEELLGLYRKAHPTVSVFNPYYNDLVKKEKELEELK